MSEQPNPYPTSKRRRPRHRDGANKKNFSAPQNDAEQAEKNQHGQPETSTTGANAPYQQQTATTAAASDTPLDKQATDRYEDSIQKLVRNNTLPATEEEEFHATGKLWVAQQYANNKLPAANKLNENGKQLGWPDDHHDPNPGFNTMVLDKSAVPNFAVKKDH